MRVTSTHLFVLLGSIHTHTEGLGALVALRTGQAVETRIGVDAALCSAHFVANIRHHVTLEEGKKSISKMQINNYMNEVLNTCLVYAHKKNRNFYLINVFTVGTISTETSRAWATLPGSIWRTVAIHSPKAWIRQTAICKGLRWQEWLQTREIDLNIAGHVCIVCLQMIQLEFVRVFIST